MGAIGGTHQQQFELEGGDGHQAGGEEVRAGKFPRMLEERVVGERGRSRGAKADGGGAGEGQVAEGGSEEGFGELRGGGVGEAAGERHDDELAGRALGVFEAGREVAGDKPLPDPIPLKIQLPISQIRTGS